MVPRDDPLTQFQQAPPSHTSSPSTQFQTPSTQFQLVHDPMGGVECVGEIPCSRGAGSKWREGGTKRSGVRQRHDMPRNIDVHDPYFPYGRLISTVSRRTRWVHTNPLWHACIFDAECWHDWWAYGMPLRVHFGMSRRRFITIPFFANLLTRRRWTGEVVTLDPRRSRPQGSRGDVVDDVQEDAGMDE